MSRRPTRKLDPVPGPTKVEQLEMETFARRLHQLMVQKNLSQSDLAKKIWGTRTDKRGYQVARNRDRISVYLKGNTIPDTKSIARIADALGVPAAELAPDITASTVEKENPELAMTVVSGHEDKCHLRVNMLIDLRTAAEVVALLTKAKEASRA